MASMILFAGFDDRPTSKAIHFHDCHQLIYVDSGRAAVEVGGRRFSVGPGDIVLFGRLEHHRVMADGDGYRRYVVDVSAHIPAADPETYRLFSILFNRPDGFSNLLPPLDDGSYELVSAVQRKLESDYAEDLSLQSLSDSFGFSVSYLCHTFKKITGTPVMDYLQSCRLAAAKRYLLESALSVSEIVARCGFTDHSNFSRSFKAQLGCTPSQFRRTGKAWL